MANPGRTGFGLVVAVALLTAGCSSGDGPTGVGSKKNTVVSLAFKNPDTVSAGSEIQLVVEARNADGGTVSGPSVTYATSTPSVATVAPGGVLRAVSEGTVTIGASTSNGVSANMVMRVLRASGVLTIFPTSIVAFPGATGTFVPRLLDANGNPGNLGFVNYTSSNLAVARVASDGSISTVGLGTATITAESGGRTAKTTVVVKAETPNEFHIERTYVNEEHRKYDSHFKIATEKWEKVLRKDLPDARIDVAANQCYQGAPAFTGLVDDVRVALAVRKIDGRGGVVGRAGPCVVRDARPGSLLEYGLPVFGVVEIDEDDIQEMASSGSLSGVIAHEIGHILGIGTLWFTTGPGALASTKVPGDPRYTGAEGVKASVSLGYIRPGQTVPLENAGGSGTNSSHWRVSVFHNEIMTGWVAPNALISATTLGSLKDIGYEVEFGGIPIASAKATGGVLASLAAPIAQAPSGTKIKDEVIEPLFVVTSGGTVPVGRTRP